MHKLIFKNYVQFALWMHREKKKWDLFWLFQCLLVWKERGILWKGPITGFYLPLSFFFFFKGLKRSLFALWTFVTFVRTWRTTPFTRSFMALRFITSSMVYRFFSTLGWVTRFIMALTTRSITRPFTRLFTRSITRTTPI